MCLMFAVPISVAAVALLLASVSMPDAGIITVGRIVLLTLSSVLLFAATGYAMRGVRVVVRLVDDHRARKNPQPTNRPIEQIAADLRRLLWQHELVGRSDDVVMRARRLRALETLITDCATQAARGLGMPYPDRPTLGAFDKPELRRLLCALEAEGLVLLPGVGLLEPDGRF
jgi:hypothetical protein